MHNAECLGDFRYTLRDVSVACISPNFGDEPKPSIVRVKKFCFKGLTPPELLCIIDIAIETQSQLISDGEAL
jgi:hypothetical protein